MLSKCEGGLKCKFGRQRVERICNVFYKHEVPGHLHPHYYSWAGRASHGLQPGVSSRPGRLWARLGLANTCESSSAVVVSGLLFHGEAREYLAGRRRSDLVEMN